MVRPDKPIIDARSTVVDDKQPLAAPALTGQSSETDQHLQQTTQRQQTTAQQPIQPNGTISQTVPDQFKGGGNDELRKYLERKIAEYKPLSDEDIARMRRRQRAEKIISGISDAVSSVANMVAVHNYSPNMYDGGNSLSAKAQARFDREKAERQAAEDRYYNMALQLRRLDDADREQGLKIWQTEQTLARQDRDYEAGRQDRKDDLDFRNKDFDERVRQWKAGFDREDKWHKEEGERWERQFKESVRQFNVTSSIERAKLGLEAQRIAHELKSGQMTFNLGPGEGNVTVSADKLNAANISRIFHALPVQVWTNVKGDPIVRDGYVVGHKDPSTEAMLTAIGSYCHMSEPTKKAIRQVAGLEKGEKKLPPAY